MNNFFLFWIKAKIEKATLGIWVYILLEALTTACILYMHWLRVTLDNNNV